MASLKDWDKIHYSDDYNSASPQDRALVRLQWAKENIIATPEFQQASDDDQLLALNTFAKYNPPGQPERTAPGVAGDVLVSLAKGVVGTGEALVGLLDIPTFGLVGKGLELVGYDPQATSDYLEDLYSPAQKFANERVEEVDGFFPTAKRMLQYPSTIGHATVESSPLMLGGAGVARGIMRVAPKVPGLIAAATGEGAVSAGSTAEGIRQRTDSGFLSPSQSLAATTSGVMTGLIAGVGGRIAKRFGFSDPDVMLAELGKKIGREVPSQAGVLARIFGGGVSEGVFEELPQSVQEQVWMNAALNEPLMKDVPEAAAQGMFAGAAMGAGANILPGRTRIESPDIKTVDNQPAPGDLGLASPNIVTKKPDDFELSPQAMPQPKSAEESAQVFQQQPGRYTAAEAFNVFDQAGMTADPIEQARIRNQQKIDRTNLDAEAEIDRNKRTRAQLLDAARQRRLSGATQEETGIQEGQEVESAPNAPSPFAVEVAKKETPQNDELNTPKQSEVFNKEGQAEAGETGLEESYNSLKIERDGLKSQLTAREQLPPAVSTHGAEPVRVNRMGQTDSEVALGLPETTAPQRSEQAPAKLDGWEKDRVSRALQHARMTNQHEKDWLSLERTKEFPHIYYSPNRPTDFIRSDDMKPSGFFVSSKTPLSAKEIAKFELVPISYKDKAKLAIDVNIYENGNKPVEFYKQDDRGWRGAAITKSAKKKGYWQTTYFDKDGFSGDTQHKTQQEAVEDAISTGFYNLQPGLLNRAGRMKSFQEGNDRVELAQKEHRQRMRNINGEIDAESAAAQFNEQTPGHDLKYDGEQDRSAINKTPLYGFTPQTGLMRGRSFSVENPSVENVAAKLNEMIDDQTKFDAKRKTALTKKRQTGPQTLRGRIKQMGGINFLNFNGELKNMPTAVKFLSKKNGMPIDTLEENLKSEGWLMPDETLLDLLNDQEVLKRGPVGQSDAGPKTDFQRSQDAKLKEQSEYEPEAPPDGEYITMKAEDLPEGAKLTIIESKSLDGWDEYEVVDKDAFGVTLKDGKTIEIGSLDTIQVRKSDLDKHKKPSIDVTKAKQQEIIEEEPQLFEEPQPAKRNLRKRPPKEKTDSGQEQNDMFGYNQESMFGLNQNKPETKLSTKTDTYQPLIKKLSEMSKEEFDKTSEMVGSNLKDTLTRVVYADDEYRLTNIGSGNIIPKERLTPQLRSKSKTVKIYRSVQGDFNEIRPGDWVALTKEYAEKHMEGRDAAKIIEASVPRNDVVWAGTDENEFFYAPKELSRPNAKSTYEGIRDALSLSTKETDAKGQGITPRQVVKAFRGKGLPVEKVGDLVRVKTPSKYIYIDVKDAVVEQDEAAIKMGYGRNAEPGEKVAGSFKNLDSMSVIKLKRSLADRGTLEHELWHFIKNAGVLNPLELKAVERAAGKDEEAQARWIETRLRDRGQNKGIINRAIQRVGDFLDALVSMFHATQRSILRKAESGEFLKRDSYLGEVVGEELSTRDQTESEAFKKWFGDSKVVDEDGKPLVVYHGTSEDFNAFNEGANFFTKNQTVAGIYSKARARERGKTGNIYPVYLKIDRPYYYDRLTETSIVEDLFGSLSSDYDGIITSDEYYIPFEPTQIKSAIGNVGTFDPTNPDIRYSTRTPNEEGKKQIDKNINETIDKVGVFLKNPKLTEIAKKDLSYISDLMASIPSFFAEKISATKKIFDASQERQDEFHERIHWMEHHDDVNVVNLWRRLNKSGKAEKAAKYLINNDRNMEGFRVVKRKSGKWVALNRLGKKFAEFESRMTEDFVDVGEVAAVEAIVNAEKEYLEKNGYSPDEVAAIIAFRLSTNKGFDVLFSSMRKLIAKSKELGLKPKTIKSFENGETVQVDLKTAMSRMSDIRGFYFPRIRKPGRFILRAFKEGEYNILETFKSMRMMNVRRAGLEKDGYKVTTGRNKRVGEDVFEMAGSLVATQQVVNSALDRVGQNIKDGSKAEIDGIEKEIEAIFASALAEQISNVIRERGSRVHMTRRTKDVYLGYQEDPEQVIAKYIRGISAGEAKRNMVMKMMRAFTGTDVSWEQFQNENPDADYKAYRAFVRENMIEQSKQPNAFKWAKAYIAENTRNQESVDRAIGIVKGIAVAKYLAFRVFSAPMVNMTALPTSAIASMKAAGIPYLKTWGLIGNGIRDYGKYRTGKGKLTDEQMRVFDHIRQKGWDNAQFNSEALTTLRSAVGKGYDKIIEYGMWTFSESERLNRAATIAGSYNGLKKANPDMSFEALMDKAKKVSDDSHGIYNSGNYPYIALGRHPAAHVTRMFYVFRTFSHTYLNNLYKVGFKKKDYAALTHMLVAPAVIAGAGASVLTPVIVMMLKAMGYDEPEEKVYLKVGEMFGPGAENVARFGLTSMIPGGGFSMKGSLSIGITDIPTRMTVKDFLGAPGSVIDEIFFQAPALIARGDVAKGTEKLLPTGFGNMIRAYREGTEGLTTMGNAPVFFGNDQVKLGLVESIYRGMSFDPARIAGIREKQWRERRLSVKYSENRSDIYAKVRKYVVSGNRSQSDWAELLGEIESYNDDATRWNQTQIADKSIKMNLKRSFKPSKRERLRAQNY